MAVHAEAQSGGGDTGVCSAGSGVSCVDVATSSYSEIFGIPIACLGLAFYLTAFVLITIKLFSDSLLEKLDDVSLVGGVLATLYSIFLLVISTLVVGKLCPLCMGLYVVNLGLLLTAWFSHSEGGLQGLYNLKGILRLSSTWAAALLFLILTPLTHFGFAQFYDVGGPKKSVASPMKAPVNVEPGTSPFRGDEDAPVTIIEFSDFECPHCRRLSDNLKQASILSPGRFKYHFKHYPMDNDCNSDIEGEMHQNACLAAAAMICAEQFGQGWALHDRMFENQKQLSRATIIALATELRFDIERFNACLSEKKTIDLVKADISQGRALKIQGTPTWFINGIQQVGAMGPEEIVSLVHQLERESRSGAVNPEKPE